MVDSIARVKGYVVAIALWVGVTIVGGIAGSFLADRVVTGPFSFLDEGSLVIEGVAVGALLGIVVGTIYFCSGVQGGWAAVRRKVITGTLVALVPLVLLWLTEMMSAGAVTLPQPF